MRVEYTRNLGDDVFETWVATAERPGDAVRALRELVPFAFQREEQQQDQVAPKDEPPVPPGEEEIPLAPKKR